MNKKQEKLAKEAVREILLKPMPKRTKWTPKRPSAKDLAVEYRLVKKTT